MKRFAAWLLTKSVRWFLGIRSRLIFGRRIRSQQKHPYPLRLEHLENRYAAGSTLDALTLNSLALTAGWAGSEGEPSDTSTASASTTSSPTEVDPDWVVSEQTDEQSDGTTASPPESASDAASDPESAPLEIDAAAEPDSDPFWIDGEFGTGSEAPSLLGASDLPSGGGTDSSGNSTSDAAFAESPPASLGGEVPTNPTIGDSDEDLDAIVNSQSSSVESTPSPEFNEGIAPITLDLSGGGQTASSQSSGSGGSVSILTYADADESGPDSGHFVLFREDDNSDQAIKVEFEVSGSAGLEHPGGTNPDYSGLPNFSGTTGWITIEAGKWDAQIDVIPIQDSEIEGTETLTLTLTSADAGYVLGEEKSAQMDIIDDENGGGGNLSTVSITVNYPTATEAGKQIGEFTLTRSGGDLSKSLWVDLTIDGTATPDIDYTGLTPDYDNGDGTYFITVEIPANASSVPITITPELDNEVEDSETIDLSINDYGPAGPYEVDSAQSQATVTIEDDPPLVWLAATTNTAAEQDQSKGVFTLSRTGGDLEESLWVDLKVQGTADPYSDYTGLTPDWDNGDETYGLSFEFEADQTEKTIDITPVQDNLVEGNEDVVLSIEDYGGLGYSYQAKAGQSSDTVTITDDAPVVSLQVGDPTATEKGLTSGAFTLSRTGGKLLESLYVDLKIGGTAELTVDYHDFVSTYWDDVEETYYGLVEIPANNANATITILPYQDNETEPQETVVLTVVDSFSTEPLYKIDANANTGTVTIDDDPPTVSLAVPDSAASEITLDPGEFTLSRSGGNLAEGLWVDFYVEGLADPDFDYTGISPTFTHNDRPVGTVWIPDNQTDATIWINPLTDDNLNEPSEDVVLTIAKIDGLDLYTVKAGQSTGTVWIENDPDDPNNPGGSGGSIGDFVWDDTDGDGIQDWDENGLGGVGVNLLDEFGGWVNSTTSDGTGNYEFFDVPAGNYQLQFTAPANYVFSPSNKGGDDTLDSNANAGGVIGTFALADEEINSDLDVGLVYNGSTGNSGGGSIGDFVWEDSNDNGVQGGGETGLSGVTVNLIDEFGTQSNSTTTNATGSYSFTDVEAGTYQIEFVAPNGYSFTTLDQGEDDSIDNDADSTGFTSPFTLAANENKTDIDAGFVDDGTTTNNFYYVSLEATDNEAVEQSQNPGQFQLERTGDDFSESLTVYFTVAGSAELDTDYTGFSFDTEKNLGYYTFDIDANFAHITISPIEDGMSEPDETIELTLVDEANYEAVLPDTGTVTLSDGPPEVSLSATEPSASEIGPTSGTFTIERSGSTTNAIDVVFTVDTTAADSATEGTDYNLSYTSGATSYTVNIPAGETSATITVDPLLDALAEGEETVTVSLATGTGYELTDGMTSDTVTIEDAASDVTLEIVQSDGAEADQMEVEFKVTRTGGSHDADLLVHLDVSGIAQADIDYKGLTVTNDIATVTIAGGSDSTTVTLTPELDNLVEGDEAIVLTIRDDDAYTSDSMISQTLTIADDPAIVTVDATDPNASELGDDTGTFEFTRTGGKLSDPLTIQYDLSGVAEHKTDYAEISGYGSITFTGDQDTVALTITPLADSKDEGSESVSVTVIDDTVNNTYQVGEPSWADAIIADSPIVTIAADDPDAAELDLDAGSFTITRTGETTAALQVQYTFSGLAEFAVDYTTDEVSSASGTITIPVDESSVTITLTPELDNLYEWHEEVTLTLSTGTGYVLGSPDNATVTIADDPPTVSIVASDPEAVEQGPETGEFLLTRMGGDPTASLTAYLRLAEAAAVVGVDYTGLAPDADGVVSFTFAGNQSSLPITITPLADNQVEDPEHVVLFLDPTLPDVTYATNEDDLAIVTIVDNGPLVTVEATDPDAAEAGSNSGEFTFRRTQDSADPLTVYFYLQGSAKVGEDFTGINWDATTKRGSITFLPGQYDYTLKVDALPDNKAEIDEQVIVYLDGVSGGASYGITNPFKATLTIADDPAVVSLNVLDSKATEPSAVENDTAKIEFVRDGGDLSAPLTVYYGIAGKASPGQDYGGIYPIAEKTYGEFTFAADQSNTVIEIPALSDTLVEGTETIELQLLSDQELFDNDLDAGYLRDADATKATLEILDDAPTITLTTLEDTTKEGGTVPGVYQLTRTGGDPDQTLVVKLKLDGSANWPADFNGVGFTKLGDTSEVTFAAGQTDVALTIIAIDDILEETTEDVSLTILDSPDYLVGTPEEVLVTIEDNDTGGLRLSHTWVDSVVPIWATEGEEIDGRLVLFSDGDGKAGNLDYSATIDWGDGSDSGGNVEFVAGEQFEVEGKHTYAAPGSYAVEVTIERRYGASDEPNAGDHVVTTTTHLTAIVEADHIAEGAPETLELTNETFPDGQRIATFEIPTTHASEPEDLFATIQWGDGLVTNEATVVDEGGFYSVYAPSHTYPTPGAYAARVTLTAQWDTHRESERAVSTVLVPHSPSDPNAPVLEAKHIFAVEGDEQDGTVVATFTVADGTLTATDFTAHIDWGDGTPLEEAQIVKVGSEFEIRAKQLNGNWHRYAQLGDYTIKICLEGAGGHSQDPVGILAAASISDAPLTAQSSSFRVAANSALQNVLIASFDNPLLVDPEPSTNPIWETGSDYDVLIDWGDGTKTQGIAIGSDGTLWVGGSYAYAATGWYTVQTTLQEPGGEAFTATTMMEVVEVSEVDDYDVRTWAYTTSGDAFIEPANPLVDWGGGIGQSLALFEDLDLPWKGVEALAHTYPEPGAYTHTVTVHHDIDPPASVTRTLNIADATLSEAGEAKDFDVETFEYLEDQLLFEFVNNDLWPGANESFDVAIDYGDGTSASATTTATFNPETERYEVKGILDYSSAGSYTIGILVTSAAGATLLGTASVTVTAEQGEEPFVGQATQRRNELDDANWLGLGLVSVSTNTGGLRLGHGLDLDQSPGTQVGGSPALVYNSDTVNPKPILEVSFQLPPEYTGTETLWRKLTWDGDAEGWEQILLPSNPTSDIFTFAVQPDDVQATGAYEYAIEIELRDTNGDVVALAEPMEYDGIAQVVNNTESLFGAGWTLSTDHRLEILGDGSVLFVYGTGESRYFEHFKGVFQSPPEDFGTLVNSGGSYIYRSKHGIEWHFDSAGHLSQVVDRHGNAQVYTRSGSQLDQIDSIDGGTTYISYDEPTGSVNFSTPGSRYVTLDKSGSAADATLDSLTDVDGVVRTFVYDSDLRLTVDQWGARTTTIGYDAFDKGTVVSVDHSLGTIDTLESAALRTLTEVQESPSVSGTYTDARDHSTEYTTDLLGRTLAVLRADGALSEWSRNDAGQVVTFTDALGRTTQYTYGDGVGLGNLTGIQYADGTTQAFVYEPIFHQVQMEFDAYGRATEYQYNATGDNTLTIDRLGNRTEYTYTTDGLLESITDAREHTTTFSYDSRRLATVEDPDGNVTTTLYGGAGNPESITDARGNKTTTVYDTRNRLQSQTDALNYTTTWVYNAQSQVTDFYDQAGIQTKYSYDTRGWLTSQTEAVTKALERITSYDYDLVGNLEKVVAPRAYTNGTGLTGHSDSQYSTATTEFAYDSVNRQTLMVEGVTTNWERTTHMGYDAVDNLISITQPRAYDEALHAELIEGDLSVTTAYTYDVLNRLINVTEAVGTEWERTSTTTYDFQGNVSQITDPLGRKTVFQYDTLDREVVRIDAHETALAAEWRTAYDSVGNVVQTTDPLGRIDEYEYNNRDLLEKD